MNDSKQADGFYATLEEAEQAIAELEANRCPCGGIDIHRVDYAGPHWDRARGSWTKPRIRRSES